MMMMMMMMTSFVHGRVTVLFCCTSSNPDWYFLPSRPKSVELTHWDCNFGIPNPGIPAASSIPKSRDCVSSTGIWG